MSVANVISVSGGKDSTALALLAVEREVENPHFVFADTGHEHAQTYEYVEYLSGELEARCGVGITTVRADFTAKMEYRREHLAERWSKDGISAERIEEAKAAIQPTGNPFLDLCLLRGRFPSTRARFCSQELKHFPIQQQIIEPLLGEYRVLVSWQGVRADESPSRALLPERDVEFGQWEPEPVGHLIYRPLLAWTADEVFAFHRKHGVKHNPLYEQGMGRVGCMPCIHARKGEIREVARRFPEELVRVYRWEQQVVRASKRGAASFFPSDKTPGPHRDDPTLPVPGILDVVKWSLTTRGGIERDPDAGPLDPEKETCASIYGLCE